MSIATEITRIQTQKELLRQGLNSKGCSIASDATLDDFVTALDDIEGGGGSTPTFAEQEKAIMDSLTYITEGRDKDYLTFKSVEDGKFYYIAETIDNLEIQYCINGGAWTTIRSDLNTYAFTYESGDEFWLRKNSTGFGGGSIYRFKVTGKCYISGNVNSLINFSNDTLPDSTFRYLFAYNNKINIDINKGLKLPSTTLGESCYGYMFYGCTGLTSIPSGLLPATTLPKSCYSNMFRGCTGLTSIPSGLLPATTLATYCYNAMFENCTGLTSIPSGLLPATTLSQSCYGYMFYGCSGLTSIPSGLLPATTLASSCYENMFNGCTGLTSIPSGLLPATTLAKSCYSYMFRGCTSLTELPSGLLPATTLGEYCYCSMFYGCSGLTSLPSGLLPVTTLAKYCYSYMFYGCNSLLKAPILPATTLANGCYEYIFSYCRCLKWIKMMATNINASNCLSNWVNNVASRGTFVKNSEATWTTKGTSGVPSGWTVQTAAS